MSHYFTIITSWLPWQLHISITVILKVSCKSWYHSFFHIINNILQTNHLIVIFQSCKISSNYTHFYKSTFYIHDLKYPVLFLHLLHTHKANAFLHVPTGSHQRNCRYAYTLILTVFFIFFHPSLFLAHIFTTCLFRLFFMGFSSRLITSSPPCPLLLDSQSVTTHPHILTPQAMHPFCYQAILHLLFVFPIHDTQYQSNWCVTFTHCVEGIGHWLVSDRV